ncbi:MAG: flagellar brake domain-containing protein [Candidatus Gastranaerophilaceae bacterium]|jgi:c-di-GMP-binding flagellar brake protein YcgR
MDFNIHNIINLHQKTNIKRIYLEDEVSYASYIKDFDDEYILIERPVTGRVPVSLHRDKEIELAIITTGGIWVGHSIVVNAKRGGSGGFFITRPTSFEKIQRREALRIKEDFSVKFIYLNGDITLEEKTLKCANISGGGIALYSKHPLEKRGIMAIDFEYEGLMIYTKIKFIHSYHDAEEKCYTTGFQFLEVDKKTSDIIHKIIMKHQIKYHKKGILKE